MFRKILLAIIICLALGSLILIPHASSNPTVLSRYSIPYFLFLLIYHTGFVLIIFAYFYSNRILAWAQNKRHLFVNFSLTSFIEKYYSLILIIILLAHILGVFLYFSPRQVFSSQPILQTDYANHFHQVSTIVETLTEYGKDWAYDPSFAAGYPVGTLFDVDMKFFEVVIFVLTKLGMNMALAYNCLIITMLLVVPIILYFVCRNFACSKLNSLFIILSGTLLWHADSTIFLFNTAGMVTFVFAVYWGLLCISLFYRYLVHGKIIDFLGFQIAVILSLMIHILMPVLVAVPLSLLYFLFFKKLKPASHFLILLSIPIAVLLNSWWISTILRFLHYQIESSFWKTLTIPEFLRSLPQMATNTGDILFILGVWGFYVSFSKNKPLSLTAIASLIWFFFLGKLGSNIPLIKTLEPSRFLIPANIIAMIGIVLGAQYLAGQLKLQRFDLKKSFPIFVLPFLVFVQLLVPYYWFKGPCYFCERSSVNEDLKPVIAWINENTTKDGRIAFSDESPDSSYSGARLRYSIDREFIGGPFSDMNLLQNYATFTTSTFFNKDILDLTLDDFMYYTDLFNIKWVITADKTVSRIIDSFEPYVKKVKEFTGKRTIIIYEVDREPDYFLEGSGKVTAELNKFTVQDANPGVTILKYHWLETLEVSPQMPIEKYDVEGSPIGFIKVTNGDTRDFVIYNSFNISSSVSHAPHNRLWMLIDVFGLSYAK